MKKLIFVLLLIAGSCKAQHFISIDSVSTPVCYPNDTMTLYMHAYGDWWQYPSLPLYINMGNITVISPHYSDIPDTNFTMWFVVPFGLSYGQESVIYITDANTATIASDTVFVDSLHNGINEILYSHEITARKYYSISGQELFSPVGLCVEMDYSKDAIINRKLIFR